MGTADAAGPFGLGCVNLGSVGVRGGVRLVHQAMDLGVRFFDTADAYGAGSSERTIGRALRRGRDRAFVATKGGYLFKERSAAEHLARLAARPVVRRVGRLTSAGVGPGRAPALGLAGSRAYASQDFSPRYLRLALEGSLRRLDTDYIDLYQLHGPRGLCGDDVLSLMANLRSEGKIRAFGVGLEGLDQAMEWLGTGALSHIQIPFGVLDPEAGDEIIPWARTHDVAVVARGVFAGGFLAHGSDDDAGLLRPGQPELRKAVRELALAAGVDALQVAAWFAASTPGVTTVLVGTSSAHHLEQSFRYVSARPPDEMMPLLEAIVTRDGAARTSDPSDSEMGGA
jgi:aryl-alcohol dehydrogenase-like predicted oxidoreductase